MQQNTESWHEWRAQGLGGSDAPVVMGLSPYSTPYKLFLEKSGLLVRDTSAPSFVQELGHRFEPKALATFSLKKDISDIRPELFVHREFQWLRASLDGWSESKKLTVEIKYVGKEKFEKTLLTNKPIEDHWVQMQHQFLVTGASRGYYLFYTLKSDRSAIDQIESIEVLADFDYISRELFPALEKFWLSVKSGEPPELSNKDSKELYDPDLMVLSRKYQEKLLEKKALDKELEEMEKQFKEAAAKEEAGKIFIGELTVTRSVRKGSVDYSSIPELSQVDLNKYRKPSTCYFSLRAGRK